MKPAPALRGPVVWPLLLLVSAPALWGGNFVVGRYLSPDIPAAWLNFLCWSNAALVIAPLGLQALITHWRPIQADFGKLTVLALLGVVGFNSALYAALKTVDTSDAAIGFAATPIVMVLINSLLMARMPSLNTMMCCLFAFAGTVLAFHPAVAGKGPGDVWRLAMLLGPPVVIWSVYSLCLKHLRLNTPPLAAFFAQVLIGLLVQAGIVMLAAPEFALSGIDPGSVVAIGYLGVFAAAVAFLCWQAALRTFSAAQASMAMFLVPLTSLLRAWAVLGERLSVRQVAGVMMIFSGVLYLHWNQIGRNNA
ncbi:MAG: DMT family transporter [Pseudomonadota bacterium]